MRQTIPIPNGTAIICGARKNQRRPRCFYCGKPSDYLCDYPGCDRPCCSKHAQPGVTAGIDFCNDHYAVAKAAYEKRAARFVAELFAMDYHQLRRCLPR
jgi:hypothetical protein